MSGVIYDAGRVVVVDKAAGVRSEDVAAAMKRRLAHRLDQPTSGLLILADDARTVQRLQRLMHQGALERRYRFVAHGVMASQTITSSMVRDRGDGLRGSIVDADADADADDDRKVATTVVDVDWDDGARCGGTATLRSGRTHQIRIHLAEAGHPIVGERVYVRDFIRDGGVAIEAPRLMLHAWQLRFEHPNSHEPVALTSPLPDGFLSAQSGLNI